MTCSFCKISYVVKCRNCEKINYLKLISDLEHLPSDESYAKALSLIDQAVKFDQEDGNLEEALTLYKSALEYLIPMITNEKNAGKKLGLRKKVDQYIHRAEAIKKELGYSYTTTSSANSSLSSDDVSPNNSTLMTDDSRLFTVLQF